jgi:hypothetical protein
LFTPFFLDLVLCFLMLLLLLKKKKALKPVIQILEIK